MYGKHVKIGRFETWVWGCPDDPERVWIKRAKAQLKMEIDRAEGKE